MEFVAPTSVYKSVWIVREYKKRNGTFADTKPKDNSEGLLRWFREKWVDLNRPGEACGRKNAKNNHFAIEVKLYFFLFSLTPLNCKLQKPFKGTGDMLQTHATQYIIYVEGIQKYGAVKQFKGITTTLTELFLNVFQQQHSK